MTTPLPQAARPRLGLSFPHHPPRVAFKMFSVNAPPSMGYGTSFAETAWRTLAYPTLVRAVLYPAQVPASDTALAFIGCTERDAGRPKPHRCPPDRFNDGFLRGWAFARFYCVAGGMAHIARPVEFNAALFGHIGAFEASSLSRYLEGFTFT